MNIQCDEPQPVLLSFDYRTWETRRVNDNYGYVLAAQPGQSQGRPVTTSGSQPIVRTAYPSCVLPKAPGPVKLTLPPHRSGNLAFSGIFMPLQHRTTTPRDRQHDAARAVPLR